MRDAPRTHRRTMRAADLATAIVAWLAAGTVAAALAWLLCDIVRHGAAALSWSFLTTAPRNAGRAGGIASILVSTALILAVALFAAVPLGVGAAVFLGEYTSAGSRFGRVVRRSLDVLAGVPSIVFGLFGNAVFCIYLKMGFSIVSGGLTLACMILPILIRTAEQGLRAVAHEHRQTATALGLSRLTTLRTILLPLAMPGIAAGLVLGIGRAAAETAALIFTAGYVDRMPGSLWDSGRAMSVHIYDLAMNVPGGETNAYATSLTLVAVLLAINSAAHLLARRVFAREVLAC